MVRFLLLGPIEVWRDEERVPLGQGREKALLVRLLLARGHPVSSDALVADLWGETAPAQGTAQVRTHVSRLRRLLGPGVIRREAAGYRLPLEGHHFDVVRFERLVATDLPRDALVLWRGAALDDVAERPFARAEATRLEELRLLAVEQRIDGDLREGCHAGLVAELEWLVAAHPLRECLWGQLLVALYRSGRQAEALRAYQRARAVLREQVGVDPGPELRRLEAAVLAQDPALDAGTAGAPPGRARGLPLELNEFIGRDEERKAVAKALREARVVTLTGVGGVGKTRLAMLVARESASRFRQGASFCDLSSLYDGGGVAGRVAAALGLDPVAGDAGAAVVDAFADQDALLLLDNCEHVLDAAAALADAVVRRGPGAVILATSREPLGIPGERVFAIGPLDVPAVGAGPEAIAGNDAVRVFVSRARDVNVAFSPDAETLTLVAQVCRMIDGIPLAIELAAARTASMTVADLLERLDRRFDVLTRGPRIGGGRHQTLKATIDWSHDLLSGGERAVLARCSVFAGGWRIAAAEAVAGCEAVPATSVLDHLASLVARSMVIADDDAGRTRYRMLETIRQYAGDRLDDTGQRDEARRAHLHWCRRFLHEAGEGMRGPDDGAWMARVAVEMDNIRAALDLAVVTADPDAVVALLGALPIGALIGTRLGSAMASLGVAVADELGGPDHPAAAVLLALRALDAVFRDANDEAIDLARRGCDIARPHGAWLGNMPWYIACVASVSAARAAELLPLADEAFNAAVDNTDEWAIAEMMTERSMMRFMAGDVDSAADGVQEGLRRARVTGCANLILRAEVLAGMCLLASGPHSAEALAHLDEGVRLSLRLGNAFFGSAGLAIAGYVRGAASTGDAARAFLQMLSTMTGFHEHGVLRMFLPPVAALLSAAGHFETAATLTGAGRDLATKGAILQSLDEANQAAMRAALGLRRYQELINAGRQLTLEQATELAVSALTELAGPGNRLKP